MADGQSPFDFDLRLLPDWLKEESTDKRYSEFEGEAPRKKGDRRGGDRDSRGPRRDRREGPGGRQGPGRGGPRRDRDQRGGGDRQRRSEPRGERGDRRQGGRGGRHQEGQGPRQPREPVVIPGLQFDFLPEPRALASIREKVLASKLAYPLFALAKMFLEQAERCRIKVHAQQPVETLYQVGSEGEVALQKTLLEKPAFDAHLEELYEAVQVESEEIKGNFQNVARCPISGTLLGPTNHHSFQPALRQLYESRFSRRMSFEDFRRQIETVSDSEVVEQWKELARVTTHYKPKDQEDASTFKSLAEVMADFRSRHFDRLVRATPSATFPGALVPSMADRHLARAILDARYELSKFPLRMANHLRSGFQQQGGHVFKHKKRILFASVHRPTPFTGDLAVLTPLARGILELVAAEPMCDRKRMLQKLAPETQGKEVAEEVIAKAKKKLAADLHWLLEAGHVIEFHDGRFDLPIQKKPEPPAKTKSSEPKAEAASTSPEEPVAESTPDSSAQESPEVADTKPEAMTTTPMPGSPDPTTPPTQPDPTTQPVPDPTVVPPPSPHDPSIPGPAPTPDPSVPTPPPDPSPEAPEPASDVPASPEAVSEPREAQPAPVETPSETSEPTNEAEAPPSEESDSRPNA